MTFNKATKQCTLRQYAFCYQWADSANWSQGSNSSLHINLNSLLPHWKVGFLYHGWHKTGAYELPCEAHIHFSATSRYPHIAEKSWPPALSSWFLQPVQWVGQEMKKEKMLNFCGECCTGEQILPFFPSDNFQCITINPVQLFVQTLTQSRLISVTH